MVDLRQFRVRFPEAHGAGHIGKVAVENCAEVESDEVAPLEHPLRKHSVGPGPPGSRGRHEMPLGHLLGSPCADFVHQIGGDLRFGAPGTDGREKRLEGFSGNAGGPAHYAQLLLVLHRPDPPDQAGRPRH
ncbi:hypothetical protein SDC9_160313 [bioreactor metagenome]|uniref:Uncharacterized protein n=1 Tax=bioreactor metagenome TaxID=1076179 RepID=A0A645FLB2_9ZZZZ